MKIWLDDVRPFPPEYGNDCLTVKSVMEAEQIIPLLISRDGIDSIEFLDLDHDLGDYACKGGDGIELVKWLIENELFIPIRLHTMNPVGRANMQALVDRYWPKVLTFEHDL